MTKFSEERRIKIVLEYRLRSNSEAGLDKAEQYIKNTCTGEKQWCGLRSFPVSSSSEEYDVMGYVEDYWPNLGLVLSRDTNNGPEEIKAPSWKRIQEELQRAPKKAETLTFQKGNTSLVVSGVSFVQKRDKYSELHIQCFTVGAECEHGWRSLSNDEFSGEGPNRMLGPLVVGGQSGYYPASGFATIDTTLQIVQAFVNAGTLDPSMRWDNPPKE